MSVTAHGQTMEQNLILSHRARISGVNSSNDHFASAAQRIISAKKVRAKIYGRADSWIDSRIRSLSRWVALDKV